MIRLIVEITQRERSSLVRLSCDHERSIGGHRFADGKEPYVGQGYDCQEFTCCDSPNAWGRVR